MKYKHYAPAAHVVLVKGSPAAYAAYVNRRGAAFPGRVTAMCFDGEESALTVPFVTYGRPGGRNGSGPSAVRRAAATG